MVPSTGTTSNPKSKDLAECQEDDKPASEGLDLSYDSDIEQLFNTLAEWNEYLEKHVPYFSEPQDPEEPQL